MKKLLSCAISVAGFLFLSCYTASSQIPQGFTYQALVKNQAGIIANTTLDVKIGILSDTVANTFVWEEQHSAKTNSDGLLTVIVGNGNRLQGVAAFNQINWTSVPLYLRVQVNYQGSWKLMGTTRMWSTPFSMVSGRTDGLTPGSTLIVESSDDSSSEPLFEVKRKDGQTVFSVYPDAVNVFIPNNTAKGVKGGFAIGGFDQAKGVSQDYFTVTRDSIRAYIDNNPAKGSKGGFAIGGFNEAKGILPNYFLDVNGANALSTVMGSPQILWYPNKNAFLAGNVHIGSADSVGNYSTALGYRSLAIGDYSQAFGYRAIALGDYSTSIGKKSVAGARDGGVSTASNAFALGNGAKATGDDSYAFGSGATASGFRSFAFGSVGLDDSGVATTTPTTASAPYTVAMGMGAQATQKGGMALGIGALASGYYSNSFGYYSTSSGYYSTSLGFKSTTSNYYAGAFGYYANAGGQGALALGYSASASSNYATAVGALSVAANTYASAFGRGATASGPNSVALGYGASTGVSATDATALGKSANATGVSAMALGVSASASGNTSVSIGYTSTATNSFSTAMGYNAQSGGQYATAIGYQAIANGTQSASLGSGAQATNTNAMAMGNGSIASGINSISLGNNNTASNSYSTAIGSYNTSSNTYSTAIGYYATASGDKSLSIGARYVYTYIPKIIIRIPRFKGGEVKGAGPVDEDPNAIPSGVDITGKGLIPITSMNRINSADGQYSLAIGNGNASTNGGAAFGVYNTASALYATTIGFQNTASSVASFAAGSYNLAGGEYSTAFGRYTEAQSENSFVIGRYNVPTGNATTWVDSDPLFQVGNGDDQTAHDAFRILKNGGTYVYADDAYYGLYVNNYASTNTGSLFGVRSYVYNNASNTGSLHSGYFSSYSYGTGINYGLRSYAYGYSGSTNAVYSGYFSGVTYGTGTYMGLYADYRTGDAIDLAEYIYDDGTTEAADVVVADINKKESVVKSTKPFQTSVVGVITTKPHLVMGNELVIDKETGKQIPGVKATRLALSGRVPVKVCLENGPIVPGDYLTSSSIKGVAMKWTLLDVNSAKDFDDLKRILTENDKRRNAIIGKAVDSFSGPGEGKVVMLISLQ